MRFFSTLIGAFHSPQTYERARYTAQGWGLLYAFLLVLITTAISCLYLTYTLHQAMLAPRDGQTPFLDSMFTQISSQLPPLQLERDGTLRVEGAQPVTIRLRGEIGGESFDTDFMTIDTTGATDHSSMETPVLITRTDIISRDNNGKIELHPLKQFSEKAESPITTRDLQDVLAKAGDFLRAHAWKFYALVLPFVWLFISGIFYVMRIVMLMLLGLVALVAGKMGMGKITYASGVRLASVAYTPVAVFNTLAFLLVLDGASGFTLFVLGSALVVGTLWLTRLPATANDSPSRTA